MKATTLVNLDLALQLFDSLMARGGKLISGMRAAVSENRDLTEEEVMGFRAEAEREDAELRDAIEARRQREVAGAGSAKITGDQGGDIRP